MKYIYALQMDAENFNWEAYLDEDTLVASNIWIGGNRDFIELNSDLGTELIKNCANIKVDIEFYGENEREAIEYYLSSYFAEGKTLSDAELEQVLTLVNELGDYENPDYAILDSMCALLSILKNIKFKTGAIHGYCQSDWAYYIAPEDINMSYCEAVYFGTGTEWRISMEETESEPDWDEVDHYYDYTELCKDADIKEWIANSVGDILPDQVKLVKIARSYLVKKYEYEIV